ncbi:IclR family transcriptional regulator C-terminal domain-containing protein [Geobacillus stearothermophilus]|uniref:Glycolate dehydrogenase, subunit GlcD n=1 Tax=Geobacillus stearothermophilus TaxID=1422 RepID=A0A150MD86_GEOSE|nr:IclR family transcriptional regulator C-terminal domain-containing protein [Geobacillus stearothermophilus]KYD22411.1 Glycolate dehydrogenase, subunit GlcD [Geobacillus stearothermophilus]
MNKPAKSSTLRAAAFPVGHPKDIAALLLIEVDGIFAGIDEQIDDILTICRRHHVREVKVAQSEEERARWWANRKTGFGAMGAISPDYLVQDGVIPRSRLPEVLNEIANISRKYGLLIVNIFHAGDGNLHPLVLFDASKPLGPVIETELDPLSVSVKARVNGVEKQNSPTELMIISISKMISYLSHVMTLQPGDVILTGSPVGAELVGPGTVIECEVDGIGTLRNTFVAAKAPAVAAEIIDRKGLPRHTDWTITDREAFFRELDTIRQNGYALDLEENEYGIRCVAVPIFDYTGSVVAAVSVSGPTIRMTDDRIMRLAARMRQIGKELSARLGHRPIHSVQP